MSAADGSPAPGGADSLTLRWAMFWRSMGFRVLPLHTLRRDAEGRPIGCSCGAPRCDGDPDGRGWGKHPRIGAWQEKATTDEPTIRGWWSRWPEAQIGIACGPESGVWVLDVDGPDGAASLDKLIRENGALPDTLTIRTGSGGTHYFFRYPQDGRKIGQRGSTVGWRGSHIDVRGAGGQVVAPPAANRKGDYTILGYGEEGQQIPDPADAPEWLIRLCVPASEAQPNPGAARPTSDTPPRPQTGGADGAPSGADAEEAMAKRLWSYLRSGAAALAAMAPNSGRNEALNRLAYRMAGLLAESPVLDVAEVQAVILDAARACGLTTGEAHNTLMSGWRGGAAKPWRLPDRDAPRGRGRPRVARDNLGDPVGPDVPPPTDDDAPPYARLNRPGTGARGSAPRNSPQSAQNGPWRPDGGEGYADNPPPQDEARRAAGGPGNASQGRAPGAGGGDGGGAGAKRQRDTTGRDAGDDAPPPEDEPRGGGDGGEWEPLRLTDYGNARRLVLRYGRDFRAILDGKGTGDRMSWMLWRDGRWQYDQTRQMAAWAAKVPTLIRMEAADIEGDSEEAAELRESYEKWANKSESYSAQKAILQMTQGIPGVTVHQSKFDGNPMLLNCRNGTLDLEIGRLYPHNRTDYQTKQIRASYDENAQCPVWRKFLHRIMGGDEEMIRYLQAAVGYSLTGSTVNQCMFVMYGNGSNGKSTFIDTIKHVLADYAGLAAPQTFAEKRDSQVPNDVAKLAGLRLVLASEPKAGSVLEESLIKQATGDAELSARFLNQEFFDFTPQFKVWMATNHKPIIKGSNNGIWRRVRLIPFEETITDAEKDSDLPAALRAEADGILAWAVEGLAIWMDNGRRLPTPAKVAEATAQYRAEMDRLAEFFSDCCDLSDKTASASKTDVYRVYVHWSREREEDPISQRAFTQVLGERGYREHADHSTGRRWAGIRLTRTPPPSATDRRGNSGGGWGGDR